EDALLRAALAPGDEVLLGNDVYGGTYRLLARVLGPWGVKLRVVDMSDLDAVASAIQDRAPRMVWVETPSNPMLRITDIAGLARLGHAAGAI
ncbi:PLP-dependent transferase, partial [Vibrio parahaemolyticus]